MKYQVFVYEPNLTKHGVPWTARSTLCQLANSVRLNIYHSTAKIKNCEIAPKCILLKLKFHKMPCPFKYEMSYPLYQGCQTENTVLAAH